MYICKYIYIYIYVSADSLWVEACRVPNQKTKNLSAMTAKSGGADGKLELPNGPSEPPWDHLMSHQLY